MSASSRAVVCAVGSKVQIELPFQSGGATAITLSQVLTDAQVRQALARASSDVAYQRQLCSQLAHIKRTRHCERHFLTFFHMVRELYQR